MTAAEKKKAKKKAREKAKKAGGDADDAAAPAAAKKGGKKVSHCSSVLNTSLKSLSGGNCHVMVVLNRYRAETGYRTSRIHPL